MRELTQTEVAQVSGGNVDVVVVRGRSYGGLAGFDIMEAVYGPGYQALQTYMMSQGAYAVHEIGREWDDPEFLSEILLNLAVGLYQRGLTQSDITTTTEGNIVRQSWTKDGWTYSARDDRTNGIGFDQLARVNAAGQVQVFSNGAWFYNN